ncbi:MAG: aminotransferase class I/II-fold pyridoxal phosphate-dependent enzyme, partial [Candidatus Krumholzibacteria bacterium]|nr:aminotransferase class I/II-fold pyridoxal phosphate-dependent enzyme [Candidatus Krumholzibacteria bacterium]
AAFDLLQETTDLRDRLEINTKYFRERMTKAGFNIKDGIHSIVPIMLGDAKLAHDMAADLLREGIYVIGFSYPVVPKGQARIRVQISAAHNTEHLDEAIEAFTRIGKLHSVLH